jgi:hypothetical protein
LLMDARLRAASGMSHRARSSTWSLLLPTLDAR